MFVQLFCRNRNEKQKNELYEVLGLLCQREAIQIEDKNDYVEIRVCPQGNIKVTEEGNSLILSATTRFAGPGFHAFVVEFFMDIQEEVQGVYELKDDLYYDGNFESLVSIYEDEIVYLKDLLLKNQEMQAQNYMYEHTFFLPLSNKNTILTPISRLDLQEFRDMDPKDLLSYFYVWNHFDKDALYYKNVALYYLANYGAGKFSLMNEESIKYAKMICDCVEIAYEMDSLISLPIKEYQQICTILQRKSKIERGIQMEEEVMQYRMKEGYHLFDNVKVVCHGMAERSYDYVNQALCLSAPFVEDTKWHYLIQASKQDNICTKIEELNKEKEIVYQNKKIQIVTYPEQNYFVVEAILSQQEKLYFHCVCESENLIPYLTQCIKESEFQLEME
ncbi:hypothetical protein [Floccifex sp.]|uniref:hypothetical protein n=1 Tax=Floccifex sp. TaxID=2815810 RepID=UPI003F05C108